MGIRATTDPYGGEDLLVDRKVGNAYDTVRHVAAHIDQIEHVSANLEAVHTVSTELPAILAAAEIAATLDAKVAEAVNASEDAQEWATNPENVPVTDSQGQTGFSAYHWAMRGERYIAPLLNYGLPYDTFTTDGVTDTYPLAFGLDPFAASGLLVTIDGVTQHQASYDIDVNGNLVFSEIPDAGSSVEVRYMGLLAISVTVAQDAAAASQLSAQNAATSESNANTSAGSANTARIASEAARDKANQWANEAEHVEVEPGLYSAYHWAKRAQATVTGLLTYMGTWDASGGAFPGSPAIGHFYKISVEGVIGAVTYRANDSIIFNGSGWDHIDNTESVFSVNGQIGAVVLSAADVGAATAAQGALADSAVQPADLANVAFSGSYTDLINVPASFSGVASDVTYSNTTSGLTGTTVQAAIDELAAASNQASLVRQTYTATAGQTTFAITYDVGFVDVWLNGVKLVVGTDFTATSGTNVVLVSGATAGDVVDIIAFNTFEVADAVAKTGDVMSGPLTLSGDPTNALHAATKQYVDNVQSPSNRTTITATGTLANGDVVVLNSDGTVSVVQGVPEGAGTPVVFESADSIYISVASIGNDKVVIGYTDGGNSSFGTAVVGTVSGTSISFGTPVVFESAASYYISVASIGNDKVVIGYRDDGNYSYGTAVVGTVSGTSISFGTPVVFESAASKYISVASIGNDKVVIGYRNGGNSHFGTAVVGTVSGTSISFGTPVVFESADSNYISVTSIGNDKVVIGYRDVGNSSYGTAVVGTVSGTSISFGTPVVFESAVSLYISVAYIGNDKVVIGYRDDGNSYFGTAVVGTVSGTSISFGTPVVFESAASLYISVASIGNDKVVIGYRDNGNSSFGTSVVGTVSGTSISFGTPVVFESAISSYISVASIGNDKVVIGYQDNGNSSFGTGIVYENQSTNAYNWLGISESAVTNADATIATMGAVVSNQTGLTTDATYYVADDGSLTTTDTGRKIGRAISATELLITEGNA